MCLYTKQTKPKIAEEDIICYKIYYDNKGIIYTPWRYYPIPHINEIVTTDIEEVPSNGFIKFGYHFLEDLIDATIISSSISDFISECSIVVKCIIPKGSKYYYGTFHFRGKDYLSYCSESFKIIENVFNCIR